MKTTRVCLLLVSAFLCLSTTGLAQSNAKPDYYHAHQNAENYQKHLAKQRRKEQKAQAKRDAERNKAYLKQHGRDTNTTHP